MRVRIAAISKTNIPLISIIRRLYVGGLTQWVHLFSFRTQKLSTVVAMVLIQGRVASRQHRAFYCIQSAYTQRALYCFLLSFGTMT